MQKAISRPLSCFRTGTLRAAPSGEIDPEGGAFGAGIIYGASMISRGEALGHERWIDRDMLSSVVDAVNATGNGVKARFSHPSLSGDGIGKYVGRWTDARLDGDRVLADLHMSESASNAPDGDLRQYVLDLASEDPDAFGISIAFKPDAGEEKKYAANNSNADGDFVSPDKDNANNYTHVRLSKLIAGDVVDEPAANPNGLFMRGQEIPAAADELFLYALGLSNECPGESNFGVDPDRLKGYAARFLQSQGLSINKPEEPSTEIDMDFTEYHAQNKEAVDARLNDEHASGYAQAKTDIDAIIEARGGDVAAGYQAFKDGKTVQEAKNEHARSLEQQLAEAKAEAEQLKAKIEADQDGVDPIELNAGAEIDEPTEGDEKVAKVKSEANKITNEYARNAYIASMGFDPNDFKFD